ncbi:hypothetical protein [Defluviicoccus vanus]|uniref:Uncharacterized protein n=1 Tax=Defluviicoccus vanus TaxID=111831 RepID=A0A7H1MXR0_9PROT|nr:hypothetical protein [Defluviicoccus vanus]QNT68246.1 hypothetical protein HQ394_01270 [Defluviicoccus vanus]
MVVERPHAQVNTPYCAPGKRGKGGHAQSASGSGDPSTERRQKQVLGAAFGDEMAALATKAMALVRDLRQRGGGAVAQPLKRFAKKGSTKRFLRKKMRRWVEERLYCVQ